MIKRILHEGEYVLTNYFPGSRDPVNFSEKLHIYQVIKIASTYCAGFDCRIHRVTFDLNLNSDKTYFRGPKGRDYVHRDFGNNRYNIFDIDFTDPRFIKTLRYAILGSEEENYKKFLSNLLKRQVGSMPIAPMASTKVEVGGDVVDNRSNAACRPRVEETTELSYIPGWIREVKSIQTPREFKVSAHFDANSMV